MEDIRFDGPGKYLVSTKEKLDADILEMFTIELIHPTLYREDQTQNRIILQVKDQAELSGFLRAVYNAHYTLIGLDRLPDRSNSNII